MNNVIEVPIWLVEFYVIFTMFVIATYTGIFLAILLKSRLQNKMKNNPNTATSPYDKENSNNPNHCRTIAQAPKENKTDYPNGKPNDNH